MTGTTVSAAPGTASSSVAGRARTGRPAWWQATVLVYAGSRVVTTALLLLVVQHARPDSRIGRHATLLDALTAWDGQWYRLIALSGYPEHLPRDLSGVIGDAWAFLPVYPWLVRVLSLGVPAAWPLTAVIVSTLAGGVAAVLLAALVLPHVGARGAVVTAALFASSPLSFVLEATYAESLGLALLFGLLLLADRRRYLAASAVGIVLAFTRPGMQAVVLYAVALLAVRAVQARRGGTRIRPREWAGGAVLVVSTFLGGLAWPAVAGWVTGEPLAYLEAELSWRRLWAGHSVLRPVLAWFSGGEFWFGPFAPIGLGLLAAAAVGLLLGRGARRAGATVRLWTASWLVYLIATVFPQSSLFRLLMPVAPVGAVLAAARTRVVVAVLVVSIALQAVWMFCVYGAPAHFWAIL